MVASALIRLPWLLKYTRIVIDRFQNKGHTCSKYFDADSYIGFAHSRSSSAESFNARIGKATHHMRYLKGTNLIPFLRIRFALLNLCAHFKGTFNRTDVEDDDLAEFLRNIYDCKCFLCRVGDHRQEHSHRDIDIVPENETVLNQNEDQQVNTINENA